MLYSSLALLEERKDKPLHENEFINVRCKFTPNSQEHFNVFFDRLVPSVAGRKLWTKQARLKSEVTASGKVSITDEALTELFVLNYFRTWVRKESPRWTNDRGGNANFQG